MVVGFGSDVKHFTPLMAAAALLIGGGYSYAIEETVTGIALLAAGLVVLGVWLALEVKNKDDKDDISS